LKEAMWKVQFILDVILEAFVNPVSNFFQTHLSLRHMQLVFSSTISVIVEIFVLKKIRILGITYRTFISKVTPKLSFPKENYFST